MFIELWPESLLDSSNLVLFATIPELFLLLDPADDAEDCIEDLTEDDFAELSAKTELEDDNAPSSPSSSSITSFGSFGCFPLEWCSDFSFKINSFTTERKIIFRFRINSGVQLFGSFGFHSMLILNEIANTFNETFAGWESINQKLRIGVS